MGAMQRPAAVGYRRVSDTGGSALPEPVLHAAARAVAEARGLASPLARHLRRAGQCRCRTRLPDALPARCGRGGRCDACGLLHASGVGAAVAAAALGDLPRCSLSAASALSASPAPPHRCPPLPCSPSPYLLPLPSPAPPPITYTYPLPPAPVSAAGPGGPARPAGPGGPPRPGGGPAAPGGPAPGALLPAACR